MRLQKLSLKGQDVISHLSRLKGETEKNYAYKMLIKGFHKKYFENILFISLRNCNDAEKNLIITLKSYLKQDDETPPPPHNIILFELDFNVKFLCYIFYNY